MKRIRILLSAILTVLLLGGSSLYFYSSYLSKTIPVYLKGDRPLIVATDKNGQSFELIRGSEAEMFVNRKIKDEKREIQIGEDYYLVRLENLTENYDDIISEKTLYALRSSVLKKDPNGIEIAGFAKKADKVTVLGFHKMMENGEVDYYYVENGEKHGYLRGKYLSTDFYETGFDVSLYADYPDYGGGDPCAIEYYSKEDTCFEDNLMPSPVNALYINAEAIQNVEDYISLAKGTAVNAFVVDIKDCYIDTQIAYESPVANEYAPSTDNAVNSFDEYQSAVSRLKEEGFYVIGRITAFKDDSFAKDHPEEAIISDGELYRYGSVCWPSIFSRKMWEYDLALAKEAVKEMGFNEIQFDYIRLPEYVPSDAIMHNEYDETPSQALTSFLRYASDELHDMNVYLSADVFGETSGYYDDRVSVFVTRYGQFWPAISNAVDVISSMPYADHFSPWAFGIESPWERPGELIYHWAKATKLAQSVTFDSAKCRTWIQAQSSDQYDIYYGDDKISSQINSLTEAGIEDGFMTWNAASSLYLYNIYKDVIK